MYMGNGQSTSQKIEQIIENYTEANAIATAKTECYQNITIDARDAFITGGCNGITVDQKCSAVSNASLDTVVKALQSATLDSESQQAAEGLALAMSVSVNDNEMVSKTLTELIAKCDSNSQSVADQAHHYDLRGITIDCSDNPDASIITLTNYNHTDAACVVKQIVDSQQQNESKSKTLQENTGLALPDLGSMFAAVIAIVALLILAPALMPDGKNKSKMFQNFLKLK